MLQQPRGGGQGEDSANPRLQVAAGIYRLSGLLIAMLVLKIAFALALIPWTLVGILLFAKFNALFGPDRGQPSETPGARSFGMAHVFAVWVGGMALGAYFVFIL